MGYNNEHAPAYEWMAFDIETGARHDVAPLIPAPEGDKRLTDPAKVEADLAKRRADQLAKLSVDPNGCCIAAIGFQLSEWDAPEVLSGPADERFMLESFWKHAKRRTLIGFFSRQFDLPVILQRSRYHGIPIPAWRDLLAPYGRAKRHIDLFDELTFDSTRKDDSSVVPRKLGTFCRLFGLDVPADDTSGADMARLIAEGDWPGVRAHCKVDVVKTVALARALGVIADVPQQSAAAF